MVFVKPLFDRPPRCLRRVAARPWRAGEGCTSFGLVCPQCGADRFRVRGHYETPVTGGAAVFCSPLVVSCAACESEEEIFDEDKDGLNGEYDRLAREEGEDDDDDDLNPELEELLGASAVDTTPSAVWVDRKTGKDVFRLRVELAYATDDDGEPEREPVEDYFESFLLSGIAEGETREVEIATFETA
jgi:hypothetical protein